MANVLKTLTRYLVLSIAIHLLMFNKVFAAEQTTETPVENPSIAEPAPVTPKFSSDLNQLAEIKPSDEQLWITVENTQVLLLKHWADGRINRGNIILLPDSTENPSHPRLINPLAKQLTLLGWTVYVPALPIADFNPPSEPEKSDPETAPSETAQAQPNAAQQTTPPPEEESATAQNQQPLTNLTADILPQPFFSDQNSYQNYINLLIQRTLEQVSPTSEKNVLIGNQKSAFWLLNNNNAEQKISHIVFIHPETPKNNEAQLEIKFKAQNLPVMGLFNINQSENEFLISFRKQLWQAPRIRIHQDIFSSQQLHLEINRYAKLITGWVAPLKYD